MVLRAFICFFGRVGRIKGISNVALERRLNCCIQFSYPFLEFSIKFKNVSRLGSEGIPKQSILQGY